jgi:hypothetical protein
VLQQIATAQRACATNRAQQERNKHAAAEQERLVDLAFLREALLTWLSCWKWSGVTPKRIRLFMPTCPRRPFRLCRTAGRHRTACAHHLMPGPALGHCLVSVDFDQWALARLQVRAERVELELQK